MSKPPPPIKKKGSAPVHPSSGGEAGSPVHPPFNNDDDAAHREVRPEIPEHRWENDLKKPIDTPPHLQEEAPPPPNLDGMSFVPPQDPDTETIAGHEVHAVTHKELMQQHYEDTGGAPLWDSSMEPNQEAIQRAQRAQQKGVLDEEVDQLTPQWMRDRQQSPPSQSTQIPAQRDMTQTAMPGVDDMGDMKSAADAIRLLNQQAAQAEADGNIVGARALREAMENFASSVELERKYVAKEVHPVLKKLKSSLGLEKIKPAIKKWAGISWSCYPSNMVLDSWFFDNLWDDRRNFSPLKIATYCVGLDGVPLHEVFSVPLIHEYQTVNEEGEIREVKLKPYRKYCKLCGYEVELRHDKCKNCGSSLDPFVTPLALRLFCAEKLYTFFQEDFGPTEKLDTLVGLLRDMFKDRIVDGEELFPLAMLSVKAPTTDGSLSGEDQLQEPESSPQIQEQ